MSKRKLKILTIAEKVNVINMVEQGGKKNYEVANAFGIPSSTLSTILKNKTKIISNFKLQPTRKKIKLAEFPNLDSSLFKWYIQCKNSNLPISGPILKEKANIFAKSLGYTNFKNSTGWLDKWKKRNNITLRKPCSLNMPASKDQLSIQWKNDILTIINEYSPNEIFTADETGLFYKCLPADSTQQLSYSGVDCRDGKRSKERVTVLLCTNMSGTEKVKPLLIGKCIKPRCFKGVKSLPVDYESNPKSWMTALLWNKWLKQFDEKLFMENRKIILLIDNCTAHVTVPNLKAITIKFLPMDRTSKFQPLDHGIIQNFKGFYRKEVIRKITLHNELQNTISIDLLQAIRITDKSWRQVTSEMISNSFRKAGFQHPGIHFVEKTSSNQEPCQEKNYPEWSYIIQKYNLMPEFTFNNYVQIDENLTVCSSLNDSEDAGLTNYVCNNDKDNNVTSKKVSFKEATKALGILRNFIETTKGMNDIHFEALGTLEDAMDKIKHTETSSII
ncbi:tigger transposable element-derived protein 4-like [Rhopalosiphum maidis]|uniref:tigger transposable element-derived protein 4-like n=1 Tax=Rhopalosiphum maidis TaxID=43146 RepID=UPI000EFE9232|nr:tigger transposable element-derived protein 4-like [Rhopalosiphum maidis]